MLITKILTWMTWSFILIAIIEYIAHRYFMHRPLLSGLGLKGIFRNHALIHHRLGRNNQNVDLSPWTHFIWCFPLVAGISWFEPVGGIVLSTGFLCHSFLWTKLHRAIHDLEDNWTQSLWFYPAIRRHHLEHHHRPDRNFGAVFPFTDYLFGTASQPRPKIYF